MFQINSYAVIWKTCICLKRKALNSCKSQLAHWQQNRGREQNAEVLRWLTGILIRFKSEWALRYETRARASSPGKFTVFVLDAALVGAVAARLGLELDVAELQHSCHQLQHGLHFILHKTHDLHCILGRETNRWYQGRNVNPHRHQYNSTKFSSVTITW